mgnify:CR=1 FL=1
MPVAANKAALSSAGVLTAGRVWPFFTATPVLTAPNGWAVPADEIRTADIIAAANVCGAATVFPMRDAAGVLTNVTLARYRCGIVIDLTGDPRGAMDEIFEAMAGRWGWAGGTWRMRCGTSAAPVFAMDQSWLAQKLGPDGQPEAGSVVRISNGVSRENKVNAVSGRCVDADQRYQVLPFPAVRDAALIAQSLRRLIADGSIAGDPAILDAQIQPASLDLRLGAVAYRVRASFLVGQGRTVRDRIAEFEMHRVDLTGGAVLEKGCVYVIPLMEHLSLPAGITAVANAKSSTGRLDLLTRSITDGGTEFDRIPEGYHGPLYAEVCPKSFSVLVRAGQRLNQIRFRSGQSVLTDPELTALNAVEPLVSGEAMISEGLGFSVDLRPASGDLVGYRAKPHTGVIDLDKIGHYPASEFWEEVRSKDGRIILDPGAFYILVSREAVTIPPDYAAEMAPFLAMVGEFRVHYAGFFDPGFGHAAAGGAGSRGVLEVRCHEAPFVLEHGQVVGRLVYEKMAERPETLYGREIASNYQGQGLKLAKQFR